MQLKSMNLPRNPGLCFRNMQIGKDDGGCALKILVPCLLYGLFIRAMDKNYSSGADVDPRGKFCVSFSPPETRENKYK